MGLEKLKKLEVRSCRSLKEIVAKEGEVEVINQIVFPELNSLVLENLAHLTHFGNWSCNFECPSLKILRVVDCPKINTLALFRLGSSQKLKTINVGSKETPQDHDLDIAIDCRFNDQVSFPSFCKLPVLNIVGCNKLLNAVSQDLLHGLQYTETLKVEYCSSVRALFDLEGLIIGQRHASVVSGLKKLEFSHLPKLMGLCSQDPQGILDFQNLREVIVYKCDLLGNMFSFSMAMALEQLEVLEICSCEGLEEVVAEGTKQVAVKIAFPRLNSLSLEDLPNLTNICAGSHDFGCPSLTKLKINDCPKLKIFNDKVQFPNLEKVKLSYIGNINEMWHGCSPMMSFGKLRFLNVIVCFELSSDFTSKLLQSLPGMEILTLKWCTSLEEVFNLKGLPDEELQAMVSSQLRDLRLKFLPRLVHVWKLDPRGVLGFHQLTSIEIVSCNSLRNLFTPSMARSLVKLQVLTIKWCHMMEVIVTDEELGETAINEIVFPRMNRLVLANLPNVTSFCWANYDFEFPSLETVWLERCPKLQTFTSGCTRTPIMEKIYASPDQWVWMRDLNHYVQQRVLKAKELAMDDHKDDDDDNNEDKSYEREQGERSRQRESWW